MSWTTQRGEEAVGTMSLDDTAIEQKLQRSAHTCDLPQFSYEEGRTTETPVSWLRVMQKDLRASMPGEHTTVVNIRRDSTLAVVQNVICPAPRNRNRSIIESHLHYPLWKSCDQPRGGMDASQCKDYVLTLLFMKHVSDKHAGHDDLHADLEVPRGEASARWSKRSRWQA